MSRYQASMRMGALNLLILIIALSLTVLSVLTLVTAHANTALTDAQATAATETYTEEIAGQTFLASLDKKLLPSKEAGKVASGLNSALRLSLQDEADRACEKAMEASPGVELTSTAELLGIKDLYVEMKVAFDLRNSLDDEDVVDSVLQYPSISEDGGAVGEEIIDDDPSAPSASDARIVDGGRIVQDSDILQGNAEDAAIDQRYYMEIARVLEDCVGGISLDINTSNGRNLDILIGIKADGNYVVLNWKASKIWYAEETKETLWMG